MAQLHGPGKCSHRPLVEWQHPIRHSKEPRKGRSLRRLSKPPEPSTPNPLLGTYHWQPENRLSDHQSNDNCSGSPEAEASHEFQGLRVIGRPYPMVVTNRSTDLLRFFFRVCLQNDTVDRARVTTNSEVVPGYR